MALTTSELRRIKSELGYNVLASGAEPYIGVHAVFEQVVQTYMTAGASTTSSTAVTAASAPTPVTLTLASATGFAAFDRVVVDVDDRMEVATVSVVSGSTIVLLLSKAHSGTYPVQVEGGEGLVRQILHRIDLLQRPGGMIEKAVTTAGVKKADEVEFFGTGTEGRSRINEVERKLATYRQELADALGVVNLRTTRSGASSNTSLY